MEIAKKYLGFFHKLKADFKSGLNDMNNKYKLMKSLYKSIKVVKK